LIPDYDILIAISNEQKQLIHSNIRMLNSKHVKGHQDNNTLFHQLSRPAQLIVAADELATTGLRQVQLLRQPPATTPNPHCPIYLQDQGILSTSKELHTLRWKW
jgi:hypothetical protein